MFRFIKEKYFSGLTTNSFLLACASFFSDISTEMLYPVLPVYLTQYLKASGGIVGLIEGIAQATQNIIQGFSGYLSDKLQRRKTIALFGYFLSAISKPFIGIVPSWQGVLAARFSDRLGTGIRSAPRDALIASSVDKKHIGKAFGLEGFGDNTGAFVGPLITVLLFFLFHINIRFIFYLAIIPGILAFIMILLLKEKISTVKSQIDIHIRHFSPDFWKYLMVSSLFGIGNSSNSFLILQVMDKGLSLIHTVLIYSLFNLTAAVISYPAGSLSDKYGRKPFLLLSFLIFFVAYAGFAIITNIFLAGVLFVFYGLFQGIFRSVGKSFAADFVPEHLRASGIGLYAAVVGLSGLLASIIAGQLWDKAGHAAVFIYGAACAFIGIVLLMSTVRNIQHNPATEEFQIKTN